MSAEQDILIDISVFDITYKIHTSQGVFKVMVPRFPDDDLIIFKQYKKYRQERHSMDFAIVMSLLKKHYKAETHLKLLNVIHIISVEALQWEEKQPKPNLLNLTSIVLGAHGAIWPYPKSTVYKRYFKDWEKKLAQYQSQFGPALIQDLTNGKVVLEKQSASTVDESKQKQDE